MTAKIMTWNTGISEQGGRYANQYNQQILEYIMNFLRQDNSIAFLQQIPFKTKDNSGNNWRADPVFEEFEKKFSNYDIKFNGSYNKGFIRMMTVVIAEKDSMQPASDSVYPNGTPTNREYGAVFNNLSILGIHAKNGNDNRGYLESLHGEAEIIVGDFNAGFYAECGNRSVFNSILNEHVCICNMPTRVDPKSKRRTCIDHVFVRENLVKKCKNMIVHEDVLFSDHFPLTLEIDT